MKKFIYVIVGVFFSVGIILFGSLKRADAWWLDYYIDEPTYGLQNTCGEYKPQVSLGGYWLEQALINSGWTGIRYTNYDAWPADFLEKNKAAQGEWGADDLYADYRTLSVYAGHGYWGGYAGGVEYGYEYGHDCRLPLYDMELGAGAGTYNLYTVFKSCCTLTSDTPQYDWNTKQLFGFQSPIEGYGGGSLEYFFLDTKNNGDTNVDSWLNNMNHQVWLHNGRWASPKVFSFGTTYQEAVDVASTCKLGTVGDSNYQQLCLYNRTQPWVWTVWYWLNDKWGC